MRWLRGGTLRRGAGPRALEARAPRSRLLDQVGGALAYAHRQGVVHRDVKPANVLLDEDGNAYLADFGIAARLSDADDPRRLVSGSPAYVPPEELAGEPLTPRSDLYGLGLAHLRAAHRDAAAAGRTAAVGRQRCGPSCRPRSTR